MAYQYKKDPLSVEETDRLVNAVENFPEKLIIFTLLDTGLRVAEFATLTKDSILWQERRIVVLGKGGIYGKKSKRRVVPMTERVRRVLEHHFALENEIGMSVRTIQRIVKRVANQAGITRNRASGVPAPVVLESLHQCFDC
jgi:integrase/recombinase XerD